MEFYATLPPGIEDIAAKEVETLDGRITELREGKGRIFFSAPKKLIPRFNAQLRCVERVVVLIDRGKFRTLDDIYRVVKSHDYGFIRGKSFAVRSVRAGVHDFTSLDVARIAGQAVIDSCLEAYGERLRVDLNDPDVIVRVDVVDDEFFIGIDTTGEGLHKRWWRVYNHPAHLNATIACAMLELAGWNEEKSLVDPMCGSGTIPIEAALKGRNVSPGKNREFAYFRLCGKVVELSEENDRVMEITGVEKFRKHLEGARANAVSAGVADTVEFNLGDATKLEGEYDCIVTNPPYGLRIARKGVIKRLYEKFCEAAKRCMHGDSKLVVITSEFGIMRRAIEKAGLNLEHERFVKYGGLLTKIFVAGKKS
ncbi:MAG: tRNA (guanine(6)-N2)-methyltransferase [Archaeoglobaceae archaeon]